MGHGSHLCALLTHKSILFRIRDRLEAFEHDLAEQVDFGGDVRFRGKLALLDLERKLVDLVLDRRFTSTSRLDQASLLNKLILFADLFVNQDSNLFNTLPDSLLVEKL